MAADGQPARGGEDAETFLAAIADPQRSRDVGILRDLMGRITGEPARLWGSIVGFGKYHYRYDSGREGDWFLVGFAPRKDSLSIYLHGTYEEDADGQRDALLARLGKHRMGKGCLYVRRLEDVDLAVLEDLVELAVANLAHRYPG